MNCCDYDCTQGRNCPARVAKIGRKMQAAEPLRESVWNRQLQRLAWWVLITIVTSLVTGISLLVMR